MTKVYTKSHEWAEANGDIITVGISHHAQAQLGDVVFVELPAIGKKVPQGADTAVVESVKAASEIYAPIAGEVVEVNQAIADTPSIVNQDPLGAGWFFRLKASDESQLNQLMSEADYKAFVGE